jgi:hypothetical protein
LYGDEPVEADYAARVITELMSGIAAR